MKNIEALIDDGGEITAGAIASIPCAATAAVGSSALAMLVRREGGTLNALLKRLDTWTRPSPTSTKTANLPTRSTALPVENVAVNMGRQDAHVRVSRGGLFADRTSLTNHNTRGSAAAIDIQLTYLAVFKERVIFRIR